VLRRSRAVELRALLAWSDAIWRPANFHIELPSGLHADAFVRLSDAMMTPRDAHVLASWFAPELQDRVGVVIDTGTMTGLLAAFETLLVEKGWRLGPVSVLDQYPRTDLDAIGAVMNANSTGAGRVIGILSINATGSLRDRLWSAMNTPAAALDSRTLHVLLDTSPALHLVEGIERWLPLPGEDLPVRSAVQAGDCLHCLDPARASRARIIGPTFRPVLPSEEVLLMPDTKDARANAAFWELCAATNAIGAEELPTPPAEIFRTPRKRMNIRIRFERLLQSPEFGQLVTQRLTEDESLRGFDLVLVPEGELGLDGFAAFWEKVKPVIAPASETPIPYAVGHEWTDESIVRAVREASNILILGLGAVTGASLQRGITGVQHLRDDPTYAASGLVIHARPTTRREWETLTNAFGHRLGHLWLTYIPDRSPLSNELNAIEDIDPADLDDEARKFLEQRKQLCGGARTVDEIPLLLGTRLGDRVTPHSIFGHALSAPAVYAAVASALASQRAKADETRGAKYARFEIPALVRSYYDPLILACTIRWLRPNELSWGADPHRAAERVIEEVLARAKHTDPRWEAILVAELGLAVAEGKVPRSGADSVLHHADALLSHVAADQRPAIDLAIALINRTHSFPATTST